MPELDTDGAQLFPHALPKGDVDELKRAIQSHDHGRPGARLASLKSLKPWLSSGGRIGQIAARWLGPMAAPVRAILFDKNASLNWALGWHQDRTIAVERREDVPGFENWNQKEGIDHVEPPFEYIERMLTLRIHLDPVSDGNAPLLISPGSHRLGRIPEARIDETVRRRGILACLADAGDVWVYRTPILHASKRSTSLGRRRVLQVDYSADDLPGPLRWHAKD